MPTDPHATRSSPPGDGTFTFDAALAAAFGGTTPGGWSRPPLLRDDPSDHTPMVRPDSPEVPKADPGRYQMLGEIARGGMGVVLKGRDPDLGRDLAVKVLKGEFAGSSTAVQRFVEEAQVGGQLQHPGLVPVYELGRFADGRPYFTMKLVKGRTLAALLAERPNPVYDRGTFLKHFEKIAEAVAYAHSRGVIHRDLKPSNVMVGAFGEVQVMDWGLAKVLPQGGIADDERASGRACPGRTADDPSVIQTARAAGGSATEAGSVLGTPAFMSPEQAAGETDKLDERADVFGLGAILCVILTGEPPYVGPTAEAVRLMAVRGQLGPAFDRLGACDADIELVGLCRACLSAERDARPRHAGLVAAAVQAYRAGVEHRARAAEVERAAAEAEAREQRKRRRVQLALAAAVSLLLAGGGGAAWWWDRQSAAQQRALDRVESDRTLEREVYAARQREGAGTALDQAEQALRDDRPDAADAALAQAANRLGDDGPAPLRDRLAALRADWTALRQLAVVDGRRWSWARNSFNLVSRDESEILSALGLNFDHEATTAAALAARVRGRAIHRQLVVTIDMWLRAIRWDYPQGMFRSTTFPEMTRMAAPQGRFACEVLAALDADAYRTAVRKAIARHDSAAMTGLVTRPEWAALPPHLILLALDRCPLPAGRRLPLLESSWRRNPSDFGLTFSLATELGNLVPRRADAIGYYRAALAIRPTSSAAWNNLGQLYALAGRSAQEEEAYRTALAHEPTNVVARCNLGELLLHTPREEEGLDHYRRAVEDDPENPSTAAARATAMMTTGHFADGYREVARWLDRTKAFSNSSTHSVPKLAVWGGKLAVRAAEGIGTNPLPVADRGLARRLALEWLTLFVAENVRRYRSNPDGNRAPFVAELELLLRDADLAGVRTPAKLAQIPADEREAWERFWAEANARVAEASSAREHAPPPRAVQ